MYCPRCGQQQVSDDMKFCSRCGLPIGGLTEWLAGGGALIRREPETQVYSPQPRPRRKGVRRGAKLMFISGVLFFIFLVIGLAIDEGAVMIVPFMLFFVSLVIMLYSRFFEEPKPIKSQQTSGLGAMSQGSALPPASTIPLHGPGNFAGQQVRTNELVQPPSVTENTTKLLDQE